MQAALQEYALNNNGRFPAGQPTAEASLSLLYKSNYVNAYLLRGMIPSEKAVQTVLSRGGVLAPDSCGWQYVAGLTSADDPKIAILWCKAALGHNGQRTKDAGREVLFLGGREWVSGADWPKFLRDQQVLLNKRTLREKTALPLVTCLIKLPDGRLVESIDAPGTIDDESVGPDSEGQRGLPAETLTPAVLNIFRAPVQNGSLTRYLSFSNLNSMPVVISFSNGVPDHTNAVYRMWPDKR
jgi:hypothetical protein